MATLSAAEKFAIIKENLEEVLNPEIIEQVLAERELKVYWGESPRPLELELFLTFTFFWLLGTATTGRPHTGYVYLETN